MTESLRSGRVAVPASNRVPGANFALLCTAEAFQHFCIQIIAFLVPLFAIRELDATPREVGFVMACEYAGFLALGLPAGVWVDRVRPGRVLVAANLLRGLALLVVPILALAHGGPLLALLALMLVLSVCLVFSTVGGQRLLVAAVERERLTAANSRVEVVASVAEITAPLLAGFLVAHVGFGPVGVLGALCAFATAGLVARIREHPVELATEPTSLVRQVREGIRYCLSDPLIRLMLVRSSAYNFFNTATFVVFLVLLTDLGLSASTLGIVLSVAGGCSVVAALAVERLVRLGGLGPVALASCVLAGAVSLVLPLADTGPALVLVTVGFGLASAFIVVSNVVQVSVRQMICDPRYLGRMSATIRFVIWGAVPIGSLAGGFAAGTFGVRTTLWLTVVGELLSVIPLWWSGLRRIRTVADAESYSAGRATSGTVAPG